MENSKNNALRVAKGNCMILSSMCLQVKFLKVKIVQNMIKLDLKIILQKLVFSGFSQI